MRADPLPEDADDDGFDLGAVSVFSVWNCSCGTMLVPATNGDNVGEGLSLGLMLPLVVGDRGELAP